MSQVELSPFTHNVSQRIALVAGAPKLSDDALAALRQELPPSEERAAVAQELLGLAARFVQEAPQSSLVIVLQLLELAVTVSADIADDASRFDLSEVRKAVGPDAVREQLSKKGDDLAKLGVKLVAEQAS